MGGAGEIPLLLVRLYSALHNKKLHLTIFATLICVCRGAPFYTKTLFAIRAGELGVMCPPYPGILSTASGCNKLIDNTIIISNKKPH